MEDGLDTYRHEEAGLGEFFCGTTLYLVIFPK